jgi:subtilase family serine protease
VTIKNQGDTAAGPSRVKLVIDGRTAATVDIGPLAVGASAGFNYDYRNVRPTPTAHLVTASADSANAIEEMREDNNTGTLTVWVVGKPDLVVVDLSASPPTVPAGGSAWIEFRVKNREGSVAGASHAALYIDGRFVAQFDVGSLQPGETSALLRYQYTNVPASPRRHSVTAVTDESNLVGESNEGNNSTMIRLPVGQ